DFPLSAPDVYKILSQARCAGVAGDVEIRGVIAVKVGLNIPKDVISHERVSHLQAEARVFRSSACLGDLSWNGIGKRNREEVGSIPATNIRTAPKNGQIKKPAGGEFRAPDSERQR